MAREQLIFAAFIGLCAFALVRVPCSQVSLSPGISGIPESSYRMLCRSDLII